jgi:hypothetical protein
MPASATAPRHKHLNTIELRRATNQGNGRAAGVSEKAVTHIYENGYGDSIPDVVVGPNPRIR